MKKLLPLLLMFGCMEVVTSPDLQNPTVDMSVYEEKDFSSTNNNDLSVVTEDLSSNADLSTPYEVLCPFFIKCCSVEQLLKYAEKFTCLYPATPHLSQVGQSCDGGYLSIFVWCY